MPNRAEKRRAKRIEARLVTVVDGRLERRPSISKGRRKAARNRDKSWRRRKAIREAGLEFAFEVDMVDGSYLTVLGKGRSLTDAKKNTLGAIDSASWRKARALAAIPVSEAGAVGI